jgi:penicillin-binding protein 1C
MSPVASAFRRKISVASTFRWMLGLTLSLLLILAAAWIRCGSIDAALLAGVDAPSTVIVDRHGHVLYEALSAGGTRVRPLTPAEVPPVLEAATLAAEDRRFYAHPGVDPVSLVRAARQNLVEGRIVEGGSTITQQVAKLLIQRREGIKPRGVRAKVRETILALRLEHRLSKREVLALYLNIASYGNQTAGAGRASRLYFGVDPAMLTPAQAAFLAALPQRPTAFNPWKGLESARVRQQAVLRRMAAAGALDPHRLQEAKAERLVLRPRRSEFAAPHFVEMVRAAAGTPAPARIDTTLDLELQRTVEAIVERERPSLRAHGASNVAVVVLDNARGEWLAWEGSGNYADAEHGGAIDGVLTPRQPGSALKPFTYALAFEQGRTPASVLPDIPAHFPTAEPGVLYSPRNYDGRYRGPLLARRALAGSQNIPAVALASDVGVATLQRFLARAGLSTFDRTSAYYGLGLTLGNAEVRLDELASAYAAFARGGVWRKPSALLPQAEDAGDRLVSERTAFWITDILSDDEARAETFGRGSYLEFPFPVAVKTGTSQAYHDNWTVGYTRDVTVGVWVGNFDRTPLRDSSGVTGAGPIFHAVMLAAVEGRASENARGIMLPPGGLTEDTICALSGMRANDSCPSRAKEWVEASGGSSPCDWHHAGDEGLQTIYPPQYRQWAATFAKATVAKASVRTTAPEAAVSAITLRAKTDTARPPAAPATALAIASPPSGATYSIDPTLRREFQALTLRAIAPRPTTLTWTVNGASIGTAPSDRALSWPLAAGAHAIEVRDERGAIARASIVVK